MPSKLEVMQEMESRGILPADKSPLLQEARSRGLIPDPNASLGDIAKSGFMLEKNPAEGLPGVHPLNFLARFGGEYGLPIAAGMAATPGGPAAMGAAAAGARAVQHAAGQGLIAAGETKGTLKSGPEMGLDTAIQGASEAGGAYAAPYVQKGLSTVAQKVGLPEMWSGIKGFGGRMLTSFNKTFGDIPEESTQRLIQRPNEVMPWTGARPTDAKDAADVFRGAVEAQGENAKAGYEEAWNSALGNGGKYGPGFKVNLMDEIGGDAAKIRDKFNYGSVLQSANHQDAKVFNGFWSDINNMKEASAKDIWELQGNLNAAIRKAADTGNSDLAKSLGELKGVMESKVLKSIPEVAEANTPYAAAKSLSADTAGLRARKNLPQAVSNAYKNNTTDVDILNRAGEANPVVQSSIDAMRDAMARKDLAVPGLFSGFWAPEEAMARLATRGAVYGTNLASRAAGGLASLGGPAAFGPAVQSGIPRRTR
jgi:hypothetical protein